MKTLDIFTTSNQNLRRSKLRTFLTLLAIAIGTFTLALSLGLGQGLKNYISLQLGQYKNVNLYQVEKTTLNDFSGGIGNKDPQTYNPNTSASSASYLNNFITSADLTSLGQVNGVNNVEIPYQATFLYALSPNGTKYLASNSVFLPENPTTLTYGNQLTSVDQGEVLLSQKFAPLVGASDSKSSIGKVLDLFYKDYSGQIKEVKLTVKGVYQPSLIQSPIIIDKFDAKNVAESQSLNNTPQSNIVFVSRNLNVPDATFKTNLKNAKFTGKSFADVNNTLNSIITGVQISLAAFSGVAILASVVGVINTLFMSVLERTREIGLFRALGSKKKTIFALFSVEAMLLGFWGGLSGIALSLLAEQAINAIAAKTFLKGIEGIKLLNISPLLSVEIILIIAAITFIAGLIPAIKASRVDPIESLRYE